MEATAIVLKLLGESQRRRSASVRIGKRQKLMKRRRNAAMRARRLCARVGVTARARGIMPIASDGWRRRVVGSALKCTVKNIFAFVLRSARLHDVRTTKHAQLATAFAGSVQTSRL
jgi:hypothetical protein